MELLYIAQQLCMPMSEVAVNWKEIEGTYNYLPVCRNNSPIPSAGSKLAPFWSGVQMGRDILFIKLRYMFGIWKLNSNKPKLQ